MTTKSDHPIKTVSDKTGLSQHILRIWERRYKAVTPARTDTKRRYYSDEDIERLRILKALTEEGRRIGQVAQLPLDELKELERALKRPVSPSGSGVPITSDNLLECCLSAVQHLDAHALDICLAQASVLLSPMALIEKLITPLLTQINSQWRRGTLRQVNNQFATTYLRHFLFHITKAYSVSPQAPLMVTGLMHSQTHEFGALFAMAVAAALGWRTLYLGPTLPPEEIAAAVHHLHAPVVALNFAYPHDDPLIHRDLKQLKRLLPSATKLIVGGPGIESYAKTLEEVGAVTAPTLSEFQAFLDSHPLPLPEYHPHKAA